MEKVFNPIGHHFIVEASGCDASIISDVDKVQKILVEAAAKAGATIWTVSFHKFNPQGVSGVVVISESHLSIHTWPEFGYAAIDIYTCGDHVKPDIGINSAVEAFKASSSHITELTRGIEEGDREFYHSLVTWEEDHDKPDG
ncbi:adenosylmethionine decarboxylase [Acidobacteriota bacterium]